MTSNEQEASIARTAVRFGWTALLLWAVLGVGLEAAQGFKVAAILDDELTRTLLRLGHAHGVGASLAILVWSVAAPPSSKRGDVLYAFIAGALLLPLGFTLGAIDHPEGDPSVGVLLSPLGAAALLYAIARTALAAFRPSSDPASEETVDR